MQSITRNPSSYNSSLSYCYSLTNTNNAFTGSDSTTSCWIGCNRGALESTYVYFNFDCSSIPVNATIYSVECSVKCNISDITKFMECEVQLFSGGSTTPKGVASTFNETATVYNLNTGSSWSRSDLDNLTIKLSTRNRRVYDGYIYFYGATLTVHYAVEYNISVASAAGSNGYIVSDGGFAKVEEGNDYILSISPYYSSDVLLTLKDNNIDVSNLIVPVLVGNSYRFNYHLYNVQTNHNIVIYVNAGYVIELKTDDNPIYSISPATSSTVTPNSSYTLTITPDNFSACVLTFYDNNIDKTSSLVKNNNNQTYTYSLSNINANHVLDISGTNWFNVTTNLTGNGTILGAGSYSMGDVDITITPTNQNSLVTCTDNNTNVTSQLVRNGNDYIYTINNINGHHNVVATISGPYTITTSKTGDGSITPTITNVQHGSTQIITITPQHFNGQDVSLTDNGVTVSANLVVSGSSYTYTLTNITADHTLVATISLRTYTITTSVSGGGTITPTSTVSYGNSKTITITPSSQNSTVQLTDNNVDVSGSLVSSGNSYTYTISSVTTNHTLAATITAYVPPSQTKYPWYINISEHPEFGNNHTMVNDFMQIKESDIPHIKDSGGNWQQATAVYYKHNGGWLLLWGTPVVPKLLFAADFTSDLSYISYIDNNATGNFSVKTGFNPTYTTSDGIYLTENTSNFLMGIQVPTELNTFLHTSGQEVWFTCCAKVNNYTKTDGNSATDYGWGTNLLNRNDSAHNIFSINGEHYKNIPGEPYIPAGTTVWLKSYYSSNGYFTEYVYSNSTWTGSNAYTNPGTWKQHYQNTTTSKALWNNQNHKYLGFHKAYANTYIKDFKIWSQEPTDSEIGI